MGDKLIAGILQARSGSTRLPGKIFLEILNKPLIELQIERLKRSNNIDKLVIATTTNSKDDLVEMLADRLGVECYRGSEHDVLDRYYQAAIQVGADYVVRLTGDDTLTDPLLIDDMIDKLLSGNFDVVTNTVETTYPEGLDASVLTFASLKNAWKNASLASQREHVTTYIFDNRNEFNVFDYKQDSDYSELRWTVDYEQDFQFMKKVYEELYPKNKAFTTQDVLILLQENPELIEINSGIIRNSGLLKSLENDRYIK